MRRYDERIDVVMGCSPGGAEAPERFVWRDRRWRVLAVQSRWVEAGAWWRAPELLADGPVEDDPCVEDDLCEVEVWRVEAATGQSTGRGVCELARPADGVGWRLRGVID